MSIPRAQAMQFLNGIPAPFFNGFIGDAALSLTIDPITAISLSYGAEPDPSVITYQQAVLQFLRDAANALDPAVNPSGA